jgi:hypothetical protein
MRVSHPAGIGSIIDLTKAHRDAELEQSDEFAIQAQDITRTYVQNMPKRPLLIPSPLLSFLDFCHPTSKQQTIKNFWLSHLLPYPEKRHESYPSLHSGKHENVKLLCGNSKNPGYLYLNVNALKNTI